MRYWLIPAFVLPLVLAAPAAYAATPDQSSDQQSGHKRNKADRDNAAPDEKAGHKRNRDNHDRVQSGDQSGHKVSNNPDSGPKGRKHNDRGDGNDNFTERRSGRDQSGDRSRLEFRRDRRGDDSHLDRHGDFRHFNRNFESRRRYHWQKIYRRPPGWYSHRWMFGERLPRGWYARNYWISSFALFGLIEPPMGCEWVRVGDDAVLVDIETGEIVRVVYNLFY